MKKIFIYIALVGMFFAGCKDFLEEENKSNAPTDEFYATEYGYNSLVNASYSSLRIVYGGAPWLFCAGTDMFVEGRQSQPDGLSEYLELQASEDEVADLYRNCFESIQICNTALYYNDKTEATTSLGRLKGEVKFVRALNYFLLVQTYGGVPLVTDMITERVLSFDRVSADKIYEFIISELEESLNLVSKDKYSGKVNERAVFHMLAKVHLTRGYESFAASDDFTKAATYADDAIAGQTLDLSYEALWTPGKEMNEEVIFSILYDEASISTDPEENGHSQSSYFGPYLGGSEVSGDAPWRSYNLCPSQYLLDLYVEEDVRWKATYMTTIFDRYYDYHEVVKEGHGELKVNHYYAAQWESTQEFKEQYAADHPEIVDWEKDDDGVLVVKDTARFHFYDGLVATKSSSNDYQTISVKKFDDPNSVYSDEGTVSTRDFIIARVAETYLIAAEAQVQLGNATGAAVYVNEVRRRAGLTSLLPTVDINDILDERALELVGEYHRWFDLKRTQTLIERVVEHNPNVELASAFDGKNGEKKILRPIPQEVLDLNRSENFQQNPAY